jgi:hypothetical protein
MSRPGIVLTSTQTIPASAPSALWQRMREVQHAEMGRQLLATLADAGAATVHYAYTAHPVAWDTTEWTLRLVIEPLPGPPAARQIE